MSTRNSNFFHGVQGFITAIDGKPITAIRSSIVGMVVSCGKGPVNVPTLVFGNITDAFNKFGPSLGDGFTGPQAMKAVFDQIGTLLCVINVCDPAVHSTVVSGEVVSLARITGKGSAANRYFVGNPTLGGSASAPVTVGSAGTWAVPTGVTVTGVKLAKGGTVVTGGSGDGQWSVTSGVLTVHGTAAYDQTFWVTYSATFVRGTDFTTNSDLGQVARVNTSSILLPQADVTVSYTYVDPTKVTATDIIGATQAGEDPATGIYALRSAPTYPGILVKPKVLIAPGFSDTLSVGQALDEAAAVLNGRAILDGVNDDYASAITYAGNFAGDDSRVTVHYPRYLITHPVTTGTLLDVPASPFIAGLIARVDKIDGKGNPYVSPSNKSITGVAGLTRPVDASPVNIGETAGESVQQFINSNDVMTSIFLDGWRAYGNTQANGKFLCVYRMADFVIESAALALVWAVDKAINGPALLDQILTVVRHFLRALENQGALVANPSPDTDNDVWFPPELNTPDQTAQGIAFLNFRMNPPTMLQQLVVTGQLTNEFVKQLFAAN